jgi:DNA-binding SARP family transcriptional activator
MNDRVEFHVRGPFRVQEPGGADITPKGSKLRGLLLLLLTSPTGKRARVWLQDKLWSDRARVQSAASLRQALFQIRGAFGTHKDLLIADRLEVALAFGRIRICEEGTGEFAEGLDVRDEEFEQWLAVERARRSEPEDDHLAPLLLASNAP